MSSLYNYKAFVTNVIDGDTIDVVIDLGFFVSIKERIRLYGIDTPEIKTLNPKEKALGLEAKKYVETKILNQHVLLSVLKKDKYGRFLGIIYYNNQDLNQELLNKGLAKEYLLD